MERAKDPVQSLVKDLDLTRRWLVVMGVVIMTLVVTIALLGMAFWDLNDYIHDSVKEREKFQCQMEQIHNIAEVDCDR